MKVKATKTMLLTPVVSSSSLIISQHRLRCVSALVFHCHIIKVLANYCPDRQISVQSIGNESTKIANKRDIFFSDDFVLL